MVVGESQGTAGVQSLPNLYRATLVISLLVLILLPIGVLNVGVWLQSRGKLLDGNLTALEAEMAALTRAIAADNSEMAVLDARVTAAGRAQQLLGPDSDPNLIWGPDSRWTEMGKAHALELWGRRQALQRRVTDARLLVYATTAEMARARAAQEQNACLVQAVMGYRFILKGLIALGVVLTGLSVVAWQLLIQRRVNAILARWTD